MNQPDALNGFPVVTRITVQWGDQDAFGHVNNTVYLRWFESARITYLERIGLEGKSAVTLVGPILAAVDCNFRRQLHYPDDVLLGARVTAIGRSSLVMEHIAWSEKLAEIAADGRSTLVVFDYQANRATPLPESVRSAIEALEGRPLPAPASRRP